MVCVRSLVPNEKKSACSAIRSATTHARGSSIIVPIVYGILRAAERLVERLGHERAQPAQLLGHHDERDHDLGVDGARPPAATSAAASPIAWTWIS